MRVEKIEKKFKNLIKNTNFTIGGVNSKDNVYLKVLERISQQEELTDDDLQMVVGGLYRHDKEKQRDIL